MTKSIDQLTLGVWGCGKGFCGLLATALGSAWYHLQCNDDTLVWDRLGMVVSFAGVLGLATAQKISLRAGTWLGIFSLVAGIAAVLWWHVHGNLTPYLMVQFGGMALLMWFALLPPARRGVSWGLLDGMYVLEKYSRPVTRIFLCSPIASSRGTPLNIWSPPVPCLPSYRRAESKVEYRVR